MKKIILLTFLSIFFVNLSNAQNGFEGTVNYNIVFDDLPAEMEGMESMLPQTMFIKIKGNKSRTEQSSGMGSTVSIADGNTNSIVTLMNIMGNKIAIKMDAEEVAIEKEKTPAIKITYLDDEKDIAGYACKKAQINIEGNKDAMIIYYTDKIKSPKVREQYQGLKGFPMEYQMKNQGLTMTMIASSVVKGQIASGEFTIPEDYEIMSMQEFQSVMPLGGK